MDSDRYKLLFETILRREDSVTALKKVVKDLSVDLTKVINDLHPELDLTEHEFEEFILMLMEKEKQ